MGGCAFENLIFQLELALFPARLGELVLLSASPLRRATVLTGPGQGQQLRPRDSLIRSLLGSLTIGVWPSRGKLDGTPAELSGVGSGRRDILPGGRSRLRSGVGLRGQAHRTSESARLQGLRGFGLGRDTEGRPKLIEMGARRRRREEDTKGVGDNDCEC
jgi:hypothetical protein